MKKIAFAVALVGSALFNSAVAETDDLHTVLKPQNVKRATAEINEMRALQKRLNMLRAPVHSREQLARYLDSAKHAQNPLNALSPEGKETFIESLTFNENGLTGFNYGVLESELSLSQINKILALFGSQESIGKFKKAKVSTGEDISLLSGGICDGYWDSTNDICWDMGGGGGGGGGGGAIPSGDYLNMECSSRATCSPRNSYICKNSC